MLIIEITKIKLNMPIIEMASIKLTGGHIGIMLILETAKIELTGGHIGIMLIIKKAKMELTAANLICQL